MMEEIKKAQELIQQAYNRGFKDGRKDGFTEWQEKQEKAAVIEKIIIDSDRYIEQGRNEAWEAIKKISKMEGYKLDNIFGKDWSWEIFDKFSASEAIKKLHAYENEIKVGDEVIINENAISDYSNAKAIVTMIDGCSICSYNVMISNGDTDWVDKDEIRKTGRTFPELIELLKKLKEDENEKDR